MMKKILAVSCFAFALCIPLIAKSQQQNQFPALDQLNRDQLIQVINCMAITPGKQVSVCVAEILNPPPSFTVTAVPTAAKNQNIVSTSSMPVYILNVSSEDNPIAVLTVDLKVKLEDIASKQIENPATLINGISVFADGIKVTTLPVNASTFTLNANNEYSIRLVQLGINIPAKSQKRISFEVTTFNRTTDKRITVTSPLNSVRIYDTVTNTNYLRSVTGLTEGQSTVFKANMSAAKGVLLLSSPATQISSRNHQWQPTTGSAQVDIMKFGAKSELNDTVLRSVTMYSSSTIPGILHLYDGNTLLSSVSTVTNTNQTTFNNLNVLVSKNTTKTLRIAISYPATSTPNASQIIHAFNLVTGATYLPTVNSTQLETITLNQGIASASHFFMNPVANFTLVGAPSLTAVSTSTGATGSVIAQFTMDVTSLGQSLPKFNGSQFNVLLNSPNGTSVNMTNVSVVQTPNAAISDGSTAQVMVTGFILGHQIPTGGLYRASINRIQWMKGSQTINQTWGLTDFVTPDAVSVIK